MLQASERTQIPILRSALGFSQEMDDASRKHIYASNILYVYENWDSPVAKRQRIMSLLDNGNLDIDTSKYNTTYGNFTGNGEKEFKDAVKEHINIDSFNAPQYNNELFEFENLEEHLDEAILYEEFHGNKQIRDYCSTLITRFKSLKDRKDFNFLTNNKKLYLRLNILTKYWGLMQLTIRKLR